MALRSCPECRKKISETVIICPRCGFSFQEANLEIYRQKLEQQRLHNQEINRKSIKIHLFWLFIFSLVIGIAGWLTS
ncbi:zinc ribbon domain-containing protein [Seminibacterium arietis]|uniref:Zinc ribbon domain-containing protein n=1 Tax=Seminibacterium arietis TaxID=1173502 RepID=A0ABW3IAJ5_9PAST